LVITHRDLTERAMRHAPHAQHISLTNFLDSHLYNDLTSRLLAVNGAKAAPAVAPAPVAAAAPAASEGTLFKLGAQNVFLGLQAQEKEQAIRFAGEQL